MATAMRSSWPPASLYFSQMGIVTFLFFSFLLETEKSATWSDHFLWQLLALSWAGPSPGGKGLEEGEWGWGCLMAALERGGLAGDLSLWWEYFFPGKILPEF